MADQSSEEIARSPRFVSMTAHIADQLLKAHNVDELERAIQLYAVVENGVYEYISRGSSKLSEDTNQAFTVWLNSGKKKLTRT